MKSVLFLAHDWPSASCADISVSFSCSISVVCVQNRWSWPPFHLWPIFTVPNTVAAYSEVYLAGIISAKLTRISQLAHGMRLIPSLWHFKRFKWESHPFIFQHSQSLTHTKLLVLDKCDWDWPFFFECLYFFFSVLALVVSHSCECGILAEPWQKIKFCWKVPYYIDISIKPRLYLREVSLPFVISKSLISRTECFCTHFMKCRTLVKWFLYIMGPLIIHLHSLKKC